MPLDRNPPLLQGLGTVIFSSQFRVVRHKSERREMHINSLFQNKLFQNAIFLSSEFFMRELDSLRQQNK